MYYTKGQLFAHLAKTSDDDHKDDMLTNGIDYDQGALEDIEQTLLLVRRAIQRLVRVLINKNILTVQEAAKLFDRC